MSQGVYTVYIGENTFHALPDAINKAMLDKGRYYVKDIIKFDELKNFKLSAEWDELFVIKALKPLVADGIFTDDDLNDNDPHDNHIYENVNSTAMHNVIDTSQNPALALDDDD